MKVALGLYTTLYSAPSALFDKTLSLIYEPIFSYLYNKGGNHLALYQSSEMLKYIKRERQEYKTLISMFMKRGDLEPLTGSWSESVLSLLPPKDRAGQIEKFTSEIKHEYTILPTSAFFYGEVWQPYYVSLLNNAGIDSVVISSYNGKREEETGPFVMNELGKRITVYPMHDASSIAVREYSEGAIDYEELRRRLLSFIHSEEESAVIFLNIDQLVKGAVKEGKGEKPGKLICDIFDRIQTVKLSQITSTKPGYLPQGWYGHDSISYSLSTLNSLFVKNATFRFLYNRYISIAENPMLRNNRFLKKEVTTSLFNTSIGTLFIHDAELSPLRYSAHRAFWRSILDAENCFWRETEAPSVKEFDYEETGYPAVVMANGTYLALISPIGGTALEFDYLPGGINFFSTRLPFSREDYSGGINKSFEDRLELESGVYTTSQTRFLVDILDRKRTEIVLTPEGDELPFIISKRYKLKANTFTLDTTIASKGNEPLSGSCSISLYLSFPDAVLLLPEQRMAMVATGSTEAKTVRYGSREADSSLTISSVTTFSLTEETESVREETALGVEEFVLYKKITFTFPLEVGGDESVTYRLNIRDNSNK